MSGARRVRGRHFCTESPEPVRLAVMITKALVEASTDGGPSDTPPPCQKSRAVLSPQATCGSIRYHLLSTVLAAAFMAFCAAPSSRAPAAHHDAWG